MDSSVLNLPIGQLYSAATDASLDGGSKENPENNPDCTTVYVGNLGHEVETKCRIASLCSPFLQVLLNLLVPNGNDSEFISHSFT